MAWVDIPGKPGWQFNDAAQPTGRTYLGKATSELRAAEVSNGVESTGRFLTQTYLQTRYEGDPTDLTFNRGELNATFQNIKNGIAGKQAASYYSALGGGAGGGATDPNFANVLSLVKTSSGNAVDVAGGLGTFSVVGNASISTAETKFQSRSLNLSSGGYAVAPFGTKSDFDFGTGAFTLECWIYRTADGTVGSGENYDAIFTTNENGNAGWGLYINKASDRLSYRNAGSSPSFYTATQDTGGLIPFNAWTHIAVASEGTSGNIRAFVNGVEGYEVAAPAGTQNTSSSSLITDLWIGRQRDDQSRRFIGYIEDIRITKGVARYTEAFTPPTAEFPTS